MSCLLWCLLPPPLLDQDSYGPVWLQAVALGGLINGSLTPTVFEVNFFEPQEGVFSPKDKQVL